MIMIRQNDTRSFPHGFTLIELLIVVVIFGVLAALAAPTFQRAYDSTKFRAGERLVMSSLKKARSYAVSNKAPFGVHVDPDHRVITVFANRTNPSTTAFESTDSVYSVDTLPQEFAFVYANFGNSAVTFLPNGSANLAGGESIILVGESGTMMGYFNISVLASTGRVSSYSNFYNW